MTIHSSGTPIKVSEINTELGNSSTLTGNLGSTSFRGLAGIASGTIKLSNFYGASSIRFALLTSGTSYTIPGAATSVTVVCIGGGGGGGGGTLRTNNTGPYTGGGGGGGGVVSYTTLSLTAGRVITFAIGAGGALTGARDGGYSGPVVGQNGGTTSVLYNGSTVCSGAGGAGGGSSVYAAPLPGGAAVGGAGATSVVGTTLFTGASGGTSYFPKNNSGAYPGVTLQANGGGGAGATGYTIDTSTHAIARTTSAAAGGSGNDWGDIVTTGPDYYGQYTTDFTHSASGIWSLAGTGVGYGGGGGGGGKDNEYWASSGCTSGQPGSNGVVFLYW